MFLRCKAIIVIISLYLEEEKIYCSTEQLNNIVTFIKVIALLTYLQVKASGLNIVNIFARA